jgi:hypothetical protein
MIRTIAIAAAVAALATPVLAKDITVHLSGKSASAIQSEIAAAANRACSDEPMQLWEHDVCVRDTIATTMNKIHQVSPLSER